MRVARDRPADQGAEGTIWNGLPTVIAAPKKMALTMLAATALNRMKTPSAIKTTPSRAQAHHRPAGQASNGGSEAAAPLPMLITGYQMPPDRKNPPPRKP